MIDVVIVGAGAAGISAGRRLRALGKSVLLIDALARLGGRAHTMVLQNIPLDMGAHWLHSGERNPLTALAESMGQKVERRRAAWGQQWRDIGATREVQHRAWKAYEDFVERLRARPPTSDSAGDAMPKSDRWRPFANALSTYINGVELDHLSVADFLNYDDAASENDWRLPNGYGAFIASLGDDLPVALSTRVTSITHDSGVTLDTDRGPIRASAAIITASSAALASGAIRFTPALDDHLHAAAQLPLGLADKVFLSIADPNVFEPETHLLGSFDHAATGSYYIRPFGHPVIECFLGGAAARELENAGARAAADFCIGQLRGLLGADLARGLSPLAVTAWAKEPSILGSYSHARPGFAHGRKQLAQPVSEILCFAGEACSERDFSTVHGAWESGLAAADWIARTR